MLIPLLFLLLHKSKGWTCGGSFTNEMIGPLNRRSLLTRSSSFSSIRLSYFYQNFDLKNSTLNTIFKSSLMPMVDSYFKTSLKVQQVQEPIILSSTTCGSVSVPEDHQTSGVSNTDVIIYITTNYLTNVEYVGYAGACEFDRNGLDNVIAGTVVINQPNFSDNSIDGWLAIMTHEMTHLLAFSQGLFDKWKTSEGQSYSEGNLRKNITIRGTTKSAIVTPNVMQKAREAFNCETLEGLELEESGGAGTAGSHWDKRVMMNDYMTAYLPSETIFSNISLALFLDTGWYQVDYTLAQMPYFGRLEGCGFFDQKCVESGVSKNSKLWCDSYTKWGCDYFALNKGGCGVTTYSSDIPTEFQYFSNSTTGGNDKYTDYCPYSKALSNGSCRGSFITTFTFKNSYESISQNSRCFESTLMKKPYKISTSLYAACYQVVACTDTTATVQVETLNVVCPFDGSLKNVTGFNGWIKCPSSNIVCNDVPCKNMCFARGSCGRFGVCYCFLGYGGDDCYYQCSEFCETCKNSDTCTKCADGYQILNGVCVTGCPTGCSTCSGVTCSACLSNYYLSSTSCLPCISNCKTCDAQSCSQCIDGFYLVDSSNCASCSQNCLVCESASTCTQCNSGYQLLNGICSTSCVQNCLSCSSPNVCSSCMNGFYISASGTCVACQSRCLLCSSTQCTSCESGYQIQGTNCLIICPSNCISCQSSSVCTLCSSGFILSASSQCECISGFYLDNGSCQICTSACLTCSSSTQCSSCKSGYYLENLNCLSCPASCLTCLSSTVCTQCKVGYEMLSGNCILCPIECLTCSSDNTCTSCMPGYISSGSTCMPCDSKCETCTSSECLTCKQSFTLLSGSCESCSSNCLLCSSSMSCKGCSLSFQISSSSCDACGSFCGKCRGGKCSQCLKGYFLSENQCKACPKGCQSCKSLLDCSSCTPGFVLSGKTCVACPSGCSRCSLKMNCLACEFGFFFKSRACWACGSNCQVCKSLSECFLCGLGYYLTSGICLN